MPSWMASSSTRRDGPRNRRQSEAAAAPRGRRALAKIGVDRGVLHASVGASRHGRRSVHGVDQTQDRDRVLPDCVGRSSVISSPLPSVAVKVHTAPSSERQSSRETAFRRLTGRFAHRWPVAYEQVARFWLRVAGPLAVARHPQRVSLDRLHLVDGDFHDLAHRRPGADVLCLPIRKHPRLAGGLRSSSSILYSRARVLGGLALAAPCKVRCVAGAAETGTTSACLCVVSLPSLAGPPTGVVTSILRRDYGSHVSDRRCPLLCTRWHWKRINPTTSADSMDEKSASATTPPPRTRDGTWSHFEEYGPAQRIGGFLKDVASRGEATLSVLSSTTLF